MSSNGLFKHRKMTLNVKEGHNNDGVFYYTTENEVQVDEGKKTVDYGVFNVPVGDPDDIGEGLYGCSLHGTRIYLMKPKVRRGDTNTNALYRKVDKGAHPSTGHARWATLYKANYGDSGNKASVVDVYEIEVGFPICNWYGNDTTGQGGEILKPSKDPKHIDYVNGLAYKLEPETVIMWKRLVKGDENSQPIPLITLRYRVVPLHTIASIRPSAKDKDNDLSKLAAAAQHMRIVEDDDGV